MTKRPSAVIPLSPKEIRDHAGQCAGLVVAAGFEARARALLSRLQSMLPHRVIVVRYPKGLPENEATFRWMTRTLASNVRTYQVVELDARRPDDYLEALSECLRGWRPDAVGEVWVDITGLPMQGICATLAAVRAALPTVALRVLYTEAAEYYPTLQEIARKEGSLEAARALLRPSRSRRHARRGSPNETQLSALSSEMSGNLIPRTFAGSSTGSTSCLILFAGYEKHRSVGVVDELNPAKLVLVLGRPHRPELQWRLGWSRKLHEHLKDSRPTAVEVTSTLDPSTTLELLNLFYGYLFADHNVAVSPLCSKMQCVAVYLFWERYRDVQLVFPLPVNYLPSRSSKGQRKTFSYVVPSPEAIAGKLSVLL